MEGLRSYREIGLTGSSATLAHGNDYVDWGGSSKRKPNEWVSAEALAVLHAAGRV